MEESSLNLANKSVGKDDYLNERMNERQSSTAVFWRGKLSKMEYLIRHSAKR